MYVHIRAVFHIPDRIGNCDAIDRGHPSSSTKPPCHCMSKEKNQHPRHCPFPFSLSKSSCIKISVPGKEAAQFLVAFDNDAICSTTVVCSMIISHLGNQSQIRMNPHFHLDARVSSLFGGQYAGMISFFLRPSSGQGERRNRT